MGESRKQPGSVKGRKMVFSGNSTWVVGGCELCTVGHSYCRDTRKTYQPNISQSNFTRWHGAVLMAGKQGFNHAEPRKTELRGHLRRISWDIEPTILDAACVWNFWSQPNSGSFFIVETVINQWIQRTMSSDKPIWILYNHPEVYSTCKNQNRCQRRDFLLPNQ